MKRFWKAAEVIDSGDFFSIALDSRPVKLPSGAALALPFVGLAEAIAQEWADAPQDFSPDNLPLTRLASTSHERIPPHRTEIIAQLAAYGSNDLLCYRAAAPADLVSRQSEAWDYWLVWAKNIYGLPLQVTTGVVPIDQPASIESELKRILSSQNDYALAALGVIVPALGTLVLGLALIAGVLGPQAACDIAALDELWQEERWGIDVATAARRERISADVKVSLRFISLCTV